MKKLTIGGKSMEKGRLHLNQMSRQDLSIYHACIPWLKKKKKKYKIIGDSKNMQIVCQNCAIMS